MIQATTSSDPTAALRAAVGRLIGRTGHWTPARWELPARAGVRRTTRADEMHLLVQRLADLGAEAEGRASRPVPRLDSDLALVDQLRVVSTDLLAAARPDLVEAGTAAVAALIDTFDSARA